MGVLHVLRHPEDATAHAAIAAQLGDTAPSGTQPAARGGGSAGGAAGEVAVLLLQDAVYAHLPAGDGLAVFFSREDAEVRGASPPGIALEWAEIVDLLFTYERVLGW